MRYGHVFRLVSRTTLAALALAGGGCGGQLGGGSGATEETVRHQKVNPDCTLVVPDGALTAAGLATPYRLRATSRRGGTCDETVAAQAAFVQAAIFDPATNKVSVYDPLVITDGTTPAVAPVVPTVPDGAVVALWFGYNGSTLTLAGEAANTLADAKCVNGLSGDPFGQVAYCNAPAFFTAANAALAAGKLSPAPPALGTGKDGLACPTVRSFAVVDQDPSDNVTTSYLVTSDGRLAQRTSANVAALAGATVLSNGSDNGLVAAKLDGVLGCTPYMAPDLADPGHLATAQPLNEISAAKLQARPIALVPSGDPMVLTNGAPDLDKLNAYRAGVDQPAEPDPATAQSDLIAFCHSLVQVAPARIAKDKPLTVTQSSPNPAAANNLFTFLAQRFNFTWGPSGLDCANLVAQPSPITLQLDGNGVCTGATIATP